MEHLGTRRERLSAWARDVLQERRDKGIYGGTTTSDHPEPEPLASQPMLYQKALNSFQIPDE